MSAFTSRQVGSANTLEYRAYSEENGNIVSPFHDIPLWADQAKGVLNMVVEVPRWTNAKLEISKEEPFNPIKQDIKKGKLRFVRNCFPHKGYIWNYGAFPQTWEDPNVTHEETKTKGDNDPLDVCEIGEEVGFVGQVKQVKVLGIMALIDEGETDWKVLVIDVNDPLAAKLNDIDDVESTLPGLVDATRNWFKIYKIPDGKPENSFAFDGAAKNKAYALEVIHECRAAWKKLIAGETPAGGISLSNVTQHGTPGYVSQNDGAYTDLPAADPKDAVGIPSEVDKWFYIGKPSF